MSTPAQGLAKITWNDPASGAHRELILEEGATATIGRSPENKIHIPERHVSRRHAVVSFQNGSFMITDLGSANGTYVNDKKLSDPFPLADGDRIRLYVPLLDFSSIVTDDEHAHAKATGTLIVPAGVGGTPVLQITAGPQADAEIALETDTVTIGRATRSAQWDIALQDRAVSRPHAAITRGEDGIWTIEDLGSANGTILNGVPLVANEPQPLQDGSVITLGETVALFRVGGA